MTVKTNFNLTVPKEWCCYQDSNSGPSDYKLDYFCTDAVRDSDMIEWMHGRAVK